MISQADLDSTGAARSDRCEAAGGGKRSAGRTQSSALREAHASGRFCSPAASPHSDNTISGTSIRCRPIEPAPPRRHPGSAHGPGPLLHAPSGSGFHRIAYCRLAQYPACLRAVSSEGQLEAGTTRMGIGFGTRLVSGRPSVRRPRDRDRRRDRAGGQPQHRLGAGAERRIPPATGVPRHARPSEPHRRSGPVGSAQRLELGAEPVIPKAPRGSTARAGGSREIPGDGQHGEGGRLGSTRAVTAASRHPGQRP
jgi:hypothetical protein